MVAVTDTDQTKEMLVHVSVGSQSVWAVTNAGNIYLRSVVTQPTSSPLQPAWLRVSDKKKSSVRFCQVVTSENDHVVINLFSLALYTHSLIRSVLLLFFLFLSLQKNLLFYHHAHSLRGTTAFLMLQILVKFVPFFIDYVHCFSILCDAVTIYILLHCILFHLCDSALAIILLKAT